MQWVVAEQSANCYSRVVVPLYDTLGPEAVSYIINLGRCAPSLSPIVLLIHVLCVAACVSVVVCQDSKVNLLFKQAESAPVLKTIVKMGEEVTAEERETANGLGLSIYTFQEVEVRYNILYASCSIPPLPSPPLPSPPLPSPPLPSLPPSGQGA